MKPNNVDEIPEMSISETSPLIMSNFVKDAVFCLTLVVMKYPKGIEARSANGILKSSNILSARKLECFVEWFQKAENSD